MPKINISFTKNSYDHTLMLNDKLQFVRDIKNATNCDLRSAKETAEKIVEMIMGLKPTVVTTRNNIDRVLNKYSKNTPENLQFLLDVLQFVKTSSQDNLEAHNIPVSTSAFNKDGTYAPPKEHDFHHSCGDECRHQCEQSSCERMVQYHDEPYCFTHSPDSGSSVPNYDSRKGPLHPF
jgi:hypothetical protein